MTKRREFSTSIRVEVIKRASTEKGLIFCEECGSLAKSFQIDHVNPDGLTGSPTLANAMLLCSPCHAEKTKQDVIDISKAKRREAKKLDPSRPKRGRAIPNGSSSLVGKGRKEHHTPLPPRRPIYADTQ